MLKSISNVEKWQRKRQLFWTNLTDMRHVKTQSKLTIIYSIIRSVKISWLNSSSKMLFTSKSLTSATRVRCRASLWIWSMSTTLVYTNNIGEQLKTISQFISEWFYFLCKVGRLCFLNITYTSKYTGN